MKKRIISLLLALMMVATLVPTAFAAGTGVGLDVTSSAGTSNLQAGDVVTVTVTLPEIDNFAGVNLDIAYDAEKFIYNDDASSDLPDASFSNPSESSVKVLAMEDTNTKTLTSDSVALMASFTVKSGVSGTASFSVVADALLAYPDGEYIPVEVNTTWPSAITVTIGEKADADVSITAVPPTVTYGDAAFNISASATNAGNNGVWTWTSSDTSVLTVSNTGEVTVVGAGKATITVKYESDTTIGSASVEITVNKADQRIRGRHITLEVGKTVDLSEIFSAQGTLSYSIANGGTISGAVLTAGNTPGTYALEVTAAETANYKAVTRGYDVTVIAKDDEPPVTAYAVNIDTVTGGTVTSDVSYAEAGETVVLTATPDKYYKLESLTVTDSYGNELDLSGFYQDYSFTMPACDVTVTAVFKIVNPFTDNPEGTYYYDAVLWAYVNDITTGTTATTFSPEKVCTRAQFVTFLWRAAGCPEVKNTTTTNFTDVDANAYYAKAVLWAVEKGITTGTTATTFSPDAAVTRAQVVTFLWRYAGSPILAENNTFTDVEANAYYTEAVKWAAKNGITTGTTATTFSPYASCTRAQVVTFLYRWFGK